MHNGFSPGCCCSTVPKPSLLASQLILVGESLRKSFISVNSLMAELICMNASSCSIPNSTFCLFLKRVVVVHINNFLFCVFYACCRQFIAQPFRLHLSQFTFHGLQSNSCFVQHLDHLFYLLLEHLFVSFRDENYIIQKSKCFLRSVQNVVHNLLKR